MIHDPDAAIPSARLEDLDLIRAFVLGGNARFTLVNQRSNSRVTFRVCHCGDEDDDGNRKGPYFVKVLTGSDNVGDYEYLGTLWDNPDGLRFVHGKKSRIGRDAASAKAFHWFLNLHMSIMRPFPRGFEFWHEGRCAKCGRVLTVPESVASGFGPICAKTLGIAC